MCRRPDVLPDAQPLQSAWIRRRPGRSSAPDLSPVLRVAEQQDVVRKNGIADGKSVNKAIERYSGVFQGDEIKVTLGRSIEWDRH
jgi:hypothetical protein